MAEHKIRSLSAWTLLPTQALFSSVLPGEYMAGRFTGQINFPQWLGKNSKTNKLSRLAQCIHNHARVKTSASRISIRLDYAPFLLNSIALPLQNKGVDGVHESLEFLKQYQLVKDDIEALTELSAWPGKKNVMSLVDSKVKASLTRAYNKQALPYSITKSTDAKKKQYLDNEEDRTGFAVNEEESTYMSQSDEESDGIENDEMIKVFKLVFICVFI